MPRLTPLLLVALLGVLTPNSSLGQPVLEAVHDTLFTASGSMLQIELHQLQANDRVEGSDSVTVVWISSPRHGSVTAEADGSLSYAPDDGFIGLDSLSYLLRTVPVQSLVVDTTESSVEFAATVTTLLGMASDATIARLTGDVQLIVDPALEPFQSGHVIGLDLAVMDSLRLSFSFDVLGTPVGRLRVEAGPSEVQLDLLRHGPAGVVTTSFFTQPNNELGIDGTVQLSGTGLLDGQVPSTPQHLVTSTSRDLLGVFAATTPQIRLHVPILFEETIDISGTPVALHIEGTAIADGPWVPARESEEAYVYVVVSPVTTSSEVVAEIPETPIVRALYPNPTSGRATLAYDLARGGFADVFDVYGRRVQSQPLAPGVSNASLPFEGIAPGLYFVVVRDAARRTVSPIIVR